MKSWCMAFSTVLWLGISSSAHAATIPATGTTTVALIPGLPAEALGSTVSRGNNEFAFPVTGIARNGIATTLFHQGSGLVLTGALRLENLSFTLGQTRELPRPLFISASVAQTQAAVLNVDDETAVSLADLDREVPIGSITDVEFRVIPEPTALLLLGAALAVAGRRLRRR